ncbi:MAG: histidinol-phosphate transaminase [Burkholderiales bacterium]|jgi:histidinol-phosphate aminotransferase|nr:histidinol-phosphate transaminase [Burkholderiales bacterium]
MKAFDANALARANVRAATPYQSARRITGITDADQGIWLNANEFCRAPAFLSSFGEVADAHLNRYPDPQPPALLSAYAKYAQVSSENLLVSRGADEAIELLIRTFCEPGRDAILYCPPTYGMYGVSAETFGVETKRVPLNEAFQLDLPAIGQALSHVKLIYVCHPNNPTGNLLDKEDLRALLHLARQQLVVVDEAYIDFCAKHSVVSWLAEFPNLVILRTLSKAFALAGLRCGFTIAHKEVIALLNKVIAPYPIPVPVALMASRALSDEGLDQVRQNIEEVLAARETFALALSHVGCVSYVFESAGNWVLARFTDAPRVFQTLSEAGIIVRDQSRQHNLHQCLRITIGSPQECEATLAVLRRIR